jgi:hypothetical protein
MALLCSTLIQTVMAIINVMQQVRKLTVCNKGFRRGSRYRVRYISLPVICLSGQWLEDLGFCGGHTIDVTCERRKLTITLSQQQRFEGL